MAASLGPPPTRGTTIDCPSRLDAGDGTNLEVERFPNEKPLDIPLVADMEGLPKVQSVLAMLKSEKEEDPTDPKPSEVVGTIAVWERAAKPPLPVEPKAGSNDPDPKIGAADFDPVAFAPPSLSPPKGMGALLAMGGNALDDEDGVDDFAASKGVGALLAMGGNALDAAVAGAGVTDLTSPK